MSTLVISNCPEDAIQKFETEIRVLGFEKMQEAIDLSRKGHCVALKCCNTLENIFPNARITETLSDINNRESKLQIEIRQLVESLEELKDRVKKYQKNETRLVSEKKQLLSEMTKRSKTFCSNYSDHSGFVNKIGDYELKEMIGEGFMGTKIYGCSKKTEPSSRFALKVFDKGCICNLGCFLAVEREIMALQKFHEMECPYIVDMKEILHDSKSIYMVMERAETDLFEFFQHFNYFIPSQLAKSIAQQILRALNVCHSMGITHRDIKPENILIYAQRKALSEDINAVHVKLADFGSIDWDMDSNQKSQKTRVGSIGFIAPEVFNPTESPGTKIDVWGYGCIIIELLFGSEQFKTTWLDSFEDISKLSQGNEMLAATQDALGKLKQLISTHLYLDKDALNFLECCLQPSPVLRSNTSELLEHMWLR